MAGLGEAVGLIRLNYDGSGVASAKSDLAGLESAGQGAGSGISGLGLALAGVSVGMGKVFGGALGSAADFEQQMDAVAAAMGIIPGSSAEADAAMQGLNETALRIGKDTAFSANEAGQAMEELAKLGISYEDTVGGVADATVNLAAAIGESMPNAAAAVGAAMTMFSIPASEAADVTDTFTAAINESATDLPDFMGGMRNLGPVMAGLGGSFEDTAAAIAYFTNFGLKGANVGVSLARALNNLATPTADATQLMQDLGIKAFDTQGKFVGWPTLMDQVAAATAGMSDEQKTAALNTIFGAEALDVMNIAAQQGGGGLRDMEAATQANGQAQEQAAARMDNFRGSVEALSGSLETAGIIIGGTLTAALRPLVDGLAALVDAFIGLPAPVQAAVAALGGLATVATGAASAVLTFGPKISALVDAFKALGIASRVAGVALGPVGIAIAAVGLAVAAYKTNFLGFGDAMDGLASRIGAWGNKWKGLFSLYKKGTVGVTGLGKSLFALGATVQNMLGLPVRDFFTGLAGAVDNAASVVNEFRDGFGASWQQSMDAGVGVLPALFSSLADGLRAIGGDETPGWLVDLASGLDDAAKSAQRFGDIFGQSVDLLTDRGMGKLPAMVQALGVALEDLTGLPVAEKFQQAADAMQSFGNALQYAEQNGLNPLQGAVLGVGAAIESLTGQPAMEWASNLLGAFDRLGTSVRENLNAGLERAGQFFDELGTALSQTDWSGAWDAVTSLLGDLDLGTVTVNILDWAAGSIRDLWGWLKDTALPKLGEGVLELGKITVNILDWGQGQIADLWGKIKSWVIGTGPPVSDDPNSGKSGLDLGSVMVDITSWAQGKIEDLWGWLKDTVLPTVGDGLLKLADVTVDVTTWAQGQIKDVWTWLKDTALPAIGAGLLDLGKVTVNIGGWAVESARDLWSEIQDWATGGAPMSSGAAAYGGSSGAGVTLGNVLVTIGDFLVELASGLDLGGKIGAKLTEAKATVESFTDWTLHIAAPAVADFVGDIGSALGDVVEKIRSQVESFFSQHPVRLSLASLKFDFGGSVPMASGAAAYGGANALDIDLDAIAAAIGDAISSALKAVLADGGFLEKVTERLKDFELPSGASAGIGAALMSKVAPKLLLGMFGPAATAVALESMLGHEEGVNVGEFLAALVSAISNSVATMIGDLFAAIGGDMGKQIDTSSVDAKLQASGETAGKSLAAAAGDSFLLGVFDGFISGLSEANVAGGFFAHYDPKTGRTTGLLGDPVDNIVDYLDRLVPGADAAMKDAEGEVAKQGEEVSEETRARLKEMGKGYGEDLITALSSDEFEAGFKEAVSGEMFDAGLGGVMMQALGDAMADALALPPAGATLPDNGEAADTTTLAQNMVQGIADGLVAAVPEVDAAVFAPLGTAVMTKMQEGITQALRTPSAPPGGVGPSVEGGGMAGDILTSLANSLATEIDAADASAFTAAATAIATKLNESLQTAMAGQSGGEGGVSLGTEIGQTLMTDLGAGIGQHTEVAVSAMTAAMSVVQTAVTTALTNMSTMANAQLGAMTGAFTVFGTNASTAMTTSMTAVQTAVTAAMTAIATTVNAQLGAMTGAFTVFGTNATGAVQGAMSSVAAAVTSGMNAASAAVTAGVTAMIATLQSAAAQAEAAGANIGAGLARGIASQQGAVEAAAANLANAASAAIQAAAQIASPSKVTQALGGEFGEGFGLGISERVRDAFQAAWDLAMAAVDGVRQGAAEAAPEIDAAGTEMADAAADSLDSGLSGAADAACETGHALGTQAAECVGAGLSEEAAAQEPGITATGTDLGTSLGEGVASGIDTQIPDITNAAADAAEAAKSGLASGMEGAAEEAESGVKTVSDAVQEYLNSLNQFISGGGKGDPAEFIRSFSDALADNARQLAGVAAGAADAANALGGMGDAGKQAGSDLENAVMSALESTKRGKGSMSFDVLGDRRERWNEAADRMRQQPIQIHLVSELDGQALDDRIIETSMGGLIDAASRNPLGRRRR